MVKQETICSCDICGKEMRESETGHTHWPCYLVLGSNAQDIPDKRYDDICDECTIAIQKVINTRQGVSPVNQYFTDKLREINE